jgi:hypothetical protein
LRVRSRGPCQIAACAFVPCSGGGGGSGAGGAVCVFSRMASG